MCIIIYYMKKGFIFFAILLISFQVLSQEKYDKSFYLIDIRPDFVFEPSDKHDVDSILRLYHATKNDTLRLYYLQLFSEGLTNEYLWTRYNKLLFDYSSKKQDSLFRFYYGCALNNLGYESQYVKNDLQNAKKYYHESYNVFKKINNGSGLGVEINNLAYIYQHEGNIQRAIELYTEAGNFFLSANQPLGLTSIYINLGDIYYKNDELIKAEEFFEKALAYAKKTNQNLVIANAYNQLGLIKYRQKKTSQAIVYYQKAADIYQKDNNFSRLSLIYVGLANACVDNKVMYRDYVFKAKDNALISPDMQVKVQVYNLVANYFLQSSDINKALIYADSSYIFAKKLSYPDLIADAAEILSEIHKRHKHYELAYRYLSENKLIRDSLNNEVTQKAVIKSQYQIEYNKKDIELKAEQAKKDAIRAAEKQQQKVILILTISAALIISVFAFIAFQNYKKTKRANIIIENQKQEVELKNEEITLQKEIVEEKQKEIIDSINYAKRIQTAVLTGKDVWDKVSKDHFILFKPKDIVSGDFYWAYNTPNNRSIFVLADCTGHGVPGGFMSMLGNSFLNEIVVENKLFKANEILNKLRAKIIAALDQEGKSEQKDGMDISLCVWNKIDNTLEFSGAHNPIWILSNGELNEVKADKMPIGSYIDNVTSFNSTIIQLQAGDIIYMSTDGFADQFGGSKGKKLKYKAMLELMIANSKEPMSKQKEILESYFESWRQNYEQVDDVSVIGVRV